MISALMWPLLIGLLLSGGFEALLKPRPRPFWQRGVAANGVHAGSWVLLFGLLVLLLQRPWFAVMVFLSLQLVVVQSSNTKSNTLNEPFICHDFEYFWDAILHPRLYVPFFGIGLAIAASSAAAVAVGAFFYWETSLVTSEGASRFLISAFEVIAIGVLVLSFSTPKLPAITLQPTQDLQRLGLFASLWAYGMALMRSPIPTPEQSPFYQLTEVAKASKDEQILPNQTLPNQTLPNIVLVQSESFFDPRPWCEEVDANLLRHYDNTRTKALQHGALNVPAWGANTVRTECAVFRHPPRPVGRTPIQSLSHPFTPSTSQLGECAESGGLPHRVCAPIPGELLFSSQGNPPIRL